MKYILTTFASLLLLSAGAQDNINTITVTGNAVKEITPDRITVQVEMNDQRCSQELPTIEAITANYVSITKSLKVSSADNMLVKQRQQVDGDRTYNFLTYKLTLISEEDLETLRTSLNIEENNYEYGYGFSMYGLKEMERHYPNLEQVETEVREMAFKNAEKEATQLATLSKMKLGSVMTIVENPDFDSYSLSPHVGDEYQNKIVYRIVITFELIKP
ncbi:MAG: SIMPL domain-containing protein [Flavobacteriales bacterium]